MTTAPAVTMSAPPPSAQPHASAGACEEAARRDTCATASAPALALRVRTLEIVWHCNERNIEAERLGLHGGGGGGSSSISAIEGVTSIDYSAAHNRLVTTGGDGCLRMWQLHTPALAAWMAMASADMTACVTHVCTMRTAWMPIAARWSPCGEMFASVHCDGKVCLWWREGRSSSGSSGGGGTSYSRSGAAAASSSSSSMSPTTSWAASYSATTTAAAADAAAAAAAAVAGNNNNNNSSGGELETWKDYRHLSGHLGDVYDVCFSPDAHYLLTGAGDGSVVVHDLAAGSALPVVQLTQSHARFCRGVAWDRWGRYVCTTGAAPALQYLTLAPIRRAGTQQQQHGHHTGSSHHHHHARLQIAEQRRCQGDYIGESCALSFRRLSWSPDGALLAVPYGKVPSHKSNNNNNKNNSTAASTMCADDEEQQQQMLHCVNLYCRGALDKLAMRLVVRGYNEVRGVQWAPCFFAPLPSHETRQQHEQKMQEAGGGGSDTSAEQQQQQQCSDKENATTAVACGSGSSHTATPPDGGADVSSESWAAGDYRMALAVWTADAVVVYTTDSCTRHSDYTDLHLHSITDVAWSSDAAFLFTASLDGYVSVIAFGDSLAPAYTLPTFAAQQPTTRAVCTLLQQMRERAYALEAERSSRVGVRAGNSSNNGSSGGGGGAVATVAVATVRKKRKIEAKNNDGNSSNGGSASAVATSSTTASTGGDVDLCQLEALMSADVAAAPPPSTTSSSSS